MESVEMMLANVELSGPARLEPNREAYAADLEVRAREVLKDLDLLDGGVVEEPKRMRTKKIVVRAGEAYIKYLKENPPPQPSKPIPYKSLLSKESNERYIASQKAAVEEHKRILAQFERFGYADIEFEIFDREGEEEV